MSYLGIHLIITLLIFDLNFNLMLREVNVPSLWFDCREKKGGRGRQAAALWISPLPDNVKIKLTHTVNDLNSAFSGTKPNKILKKFHS